MNFKQNANVKVKEKYLDHIEPGQKENLRFLKYTTKSKSYASVQNQKGTFQIASEYLEPDNIFGNEINPFSH